MHKKIWCLILAVSMVLALMPDTAMAARMEKASGVAWEATGQKEIDEKSENKETDQKAATRKTPVQAETGTEVTDVSLEGSGIEADPYRISDAGQFRLFADLVNGAGGAPNTGVCAVLTQNIDLSGVSGGEYGSWTPIGTEKNPYTGVFDGGSFAVSGLYCQTGSSYAGLFGYNAGTVRNLGVAGGSVSAGNYTGGVCGFNNGTVTGCYSTAAVNGNRYTGGVCGRNGDSGTVSVCYNMGTVSGSKYVGGVCGYNSNTAADCYNMGAVGGSGTSVGGICGYNKKTLSNCYSTGEVNGGGKDYIGSVCGYNHSGSSFENCFYLVTGTEKGNYGTAMSNEQFASGEVCWLLNGGQSENVIWHQTCGAGFPTFRGKVVYQVQQNRTGGVVMAYTNETGKKGTSAYAASAAEDNSDSQTNQVSGENAGTGSESGSDQDSEKSSDGHNYGNPKWEWEDYSEAIAVFTCKDCGEKVTKEASITFKSTEASCVADGKDVYTASVVMKGKTYRDTKTEKIEKTGHQTQEIQPKEATCEKEGSVACWFCQACGKYFKDQDGKEAISESQVVIPAQGHKYGSEAKWNWAEDYSSAEAALTCASCGKSVTQPAKIRCETDATCTKPGNTVWTATVTLGDKTYTDTKGKTAEKLPHDYSGKPEWEWGEGYHTAKAVFTCANGCDEKKTFEAIVSSKETDSTCLMEGEKVFTAVVTWDDGKKFEDSKSEQIPKKPHNYGEPEWRWADDFATADLVSICTNGCNTSNRITTVDAVISESGGNDCTTPRTITYKVSTEFQDKIYTDSHVETIDGQHKMSYVPGKDATCAKSGTVEYWVCSECGKMFSDEDGQNEVTEIVIPATGIHMLEYREGNIYWCSQCDGLFTVTANGTTKLSAAEADAVLRREREQWEKEDDSDVSSLEEEKKPDSVTSGQDSQTGQREPGDQPVQNDQSVQPDQSDQNGQPDQPAQDTSGSQPDQTGQDNQPSQPNQPEQSAQGSQSAQPDQGAQPVQPDQGEQETQDAQGEEKAGGNRDGVIEMPETADPDSFVYPMGEDGGDDSVTSEEEGVVSLRAEAAMGNIGQADQEQPGFSLWAVVVALAVFTGVLLLLILKRKEKQ